MPVVEGRQSNVPYLESVSNLIRRRIEMDMTYLDWANIKYCWVEAGSCCLHVILYRPQFSWVTAG